VIAKGQRWRGVRGLRKDHGATTSTAAPARGFPRGRSDQPVDELGFARGALLLVAAA